MTWQHWSDEELLVSTHDEPEAFGAFYRRHERSVLEFFLHRVHEPELATDLAAETFARALLGARRFRRKPQPAAAWLFGIARNVLLESRRRGRVAARARAQLALPPLVITDDLVERLSALTHPAIRLVEELPECQRHALQARVVDGRPYSEIAAELQCSEAVVRQRVSRALSSLRRQTEDPNDLRS
jgi:RNA polymerase sigma factor (sigma-70 family)